MKKETSLWSFYGLWLVAHPVMRKTGLSLSVRNWSWLSCIANFASFVCSESKCPTRKEGKEGNRRDECHRSSNGRKVTLLSVPSGLEVFIHSKELREMTIDPLHGHCGKNTMIELVRCQCSLEDRIYFHILCKKLLTSIHKIKSN